MDRMALITTIARLFTITSSAAEQINRLDESSGIAYSSESMLKSLDARRYVLSRLKALPPNSVENLTLRVL